MYIYTYWNMYRCIVGNRSLGLSTVYRIHLLEAMLLYVTLSVCALCREHVHS